MDEKTSSQQPEPTIYEQLYRKLHAYHFGTIGFLELLDRFEQILHIRPPQQSCYTEKIDELSA